MKLVFTPEAEQQAEHCDSWWRENRPSSPGLFARELAEAQAVIGSTPGIGPVYTVLDGRPVRRFLLKKTKNHLYYAVERDCIIVHSVWGGIEGTWPEPVALGRGLRPAGYEQGMCRYERSARIPRRNSVLPPRNRCRVMSGAGVASCPLPHPGHPGVHTAMHTAAGVTGSDVRYASVTDLRENTGP